MTRGYQLWEVPKGRWDLGSTSLCYLMSLPACGDNPARPGTQAPSVQQRGGGPVQIEAKLGIA